MPAMSVIERAFCRSTPWHWFARRQVLPWALDGTVLRGDVLELGSGDAAMAATMARQFPHARIVATDIDPVMVAAAQARLADLPNATATQADVTDLPFSDASFDVVTSYLMLHHVIAWEQALAEVARVLRPAGQFVGYDITRTRLATVVHQADRSPHRLITSDELLAELGERGFDAKVRSHGAGHVMRFVARRLG